MTIGGQFVLLLDLIGLEVNYKIGEFSNFGLPTQFETHSIRPDYTTTASDFSSCTDAPINEFTYKE
jgi:hypothetical protein